MSYSLKKPENSVIDLAGEASITARPLTTPVLEAAKTVALRLCNETLEKPELLAELGLDAADGKDKGIGQKLYELFLRIELGVRLIVSWQGFGDETDAEVTPDNIRAAFCLHPTAGKTFYDRVIINAAVRAQVKKNSASAAPGTSSAAAETPTATDAGKTAPTAPADSPV
jgi:hypothetical protein